MQLILLQKVQIKKEFWIPGRLHPNQFLPEAQHMAQLLPGPSGGPPLGNGGPGPDTDRSR